MGVIVQRVAEGETLKELAKGWSVPYGKLAEWITEDAGRAEQYARASRLWMDALARETVAIADGLSGAELTKQEVTAARIKIDTRLRLASKLDRERYGDSASVKVDVKDDRLPLDRDRAVLELARGMVFILAKAAEYRDRSAPHAALPAPIEGAAVTVPSSTAALI